MVSTGHVWRLLGMVARSRLWLKLSSLSSSSLSLSMSSFIVAITIIHLWAMVNTSYMGNGHASFNRNSYHRHWLIPKFISVDDHPQFVGRKFTSTHHQWLPHHGEFVLSSTHQQNQYDSIKPIWFQTNMIFYVITVTPANPLFWAPLQNHQPGTGWHERLRGNRQGM